MPSITFRVSDDEKKAMENYASLHNISLSDAIKNAFFEKLEDEYDLKVIREYEEEGPHKFYTMEEVKKELSLGDEL